MYTLVSNNNNNSCTWLWWCLIIICIIIVICISSCISAGTNSYNYINSLGLANWDSLQNGLSTGLLGPYINKYLNQSISNLAPNAKQYLMNNINNTNILNSPIYQQIKSEIIPKIDQELSTALPSNVKDYVNNNILSKLIDNQFVQDSGILKTFQK